MDKIYIVCLFVCIVFSQNCRQYEPSDKIQSGIYQVQNTGIQTREHVYLISLSNFQVSRLPFEIIVSPSSISNYNPSNGFDFSVVGGRQSSTRSSIVIILNIDEDNSWQSLSLSYFATQSLDFITNVYQQNSFVLSKNGGNRDGFIVSQIPFVSWKIDKSISYSVSAFISGVRVKDRNFQLKIVFQSVNNNQQTVLLQYEILSDPSIQMIQFSYIVYPKTHDAFIFHTVTSTYEISGLVSMGFGTGLIQTDKFTICRESGGFVCQNAKIYSAGRCVCKQGFKEDTSGSCIKLKQCPLNEQYDVLRGLCVCISRHVRDRSGTCISANCGQNAFYNSTYQGCDCINGYVFNGFKCQPSLVCPSGSYLDQQTYSCVCQSANQFIINGTCTKCQLNKFWNGAQCVCRQDLNQVNGQCIKCNDNSKYDGGSCVCNIGYFNVGQNCQKCYDTCLRCSGSSENECITCRDISYIFQDGRCIHSDINNCPVGTYKNNDGQCDRCSEYCSSCSSKQICNRCSFGFELVQQNVFGENLAYCQSICGDGKRNDREQCDDTNSRDGDGCSSNCQIQEGYYCYGSSTIRPSTCEVIESGKTHIIMKNAARLPNSVVQSIQLSFIPEYFRLNNCLECSQILDVRVTETTGVPIQIKVQYIPNSQSQFSVEFIYSGQFTRGVFTFNIRLNQKFADYFYPQQMNVVIQKTIDPANLILWRNFYNFISINTSKI